jgi:hypothetical protein
MCLSACVSDRERAEGGGEREREREKEREKEREREREREREVLLTIKKGLKIGRYNALSRHTASERSRPSI